MEEDGVHQVLRDVGAEAAERGEAAQDEAGVQREQFELPVDLVGDAGSA